MQVYLLLLIKNSGHPVGFINKILYVHTNAFNDIVVGNNDTVGVEGNYQSQTGWDACILALGSIKGTSLLNYLLADHE